MCGGTAVYAEALTVADLLYLTRIQAEVEGDTFFPEVDWGAWELTQESRHTADAENAYDLIFQVYARSR